ncbi:bifunctional MaoC family dehydratase N-terminal/OB-fold nucleic acid binding domain-containing protein [Streptomyces sp. B21-083]|uniref:bifunctional MaoC family dehydratase N-terminal/OB-fold nucleic acid binding domain-containing protein n=1 Tax=Streptomyces sp. B21-083 TaxID=3039410 RepID=UPI002FF3C4A2
MSHLPGRPPGPLPHDQLAPLLAAFEGCPAVVGGVGKDPVNEPMIRHWCEALGDTSAAYSGPDAVAPPAMLQVWTMGGLSGNQGRSAAYEELFDLLDGAGCTSVVATDCEQEYLRPLRPGDQVAFESVVESVSGPKTTKLGTGYFVTTRTDVRVDGEPVGTHRFRILKYAPARAYAPSGGPETPAGQTEHAKHAEQAGQSGQKSHVTLTRPRPVINRDNAGFWDGVDRHQLLIQRCLGCRTLRFPWLPGCNACGNGEWDTVEASGEGTVFSYVILHHPPFPAFDPPYAVGLIELAEGVRIVSNVVGVPYDKVRIGMPVRLEFVRYEEGQSELPVFRGDLPAEVGG